MSRKPWFIYIYLNLQNFRFKYIYIYIYIYNHIQYIYAIMETMWTMCPPGFLHNDFVATHALVLWITLDLFRLVLNKLVLNIAFHGLIPRNSSYHEVVCKKGALENFAKFTGKHLCRVFLIKLKALYLKRDSNAAVFLWILKKI